MGLQTNSFETLVASIPAQYAPASTLGAYTETLRRDPAITEGNHDGKHLPHGINSLAVEGHRKRREHIKTKQPKTEEPECDAGGAFA